MVKTGSTIFVTCGATVPFPELTDAILNPEFAQTAFKLGYTRIILQTPTSDSGDGHLRDYPQKQKRNETPSLSKEELGCPSIVDHWVFDNNIEYIVINYSSDVRRLIKEHVDLVISHAGTGSILDALRLQKALIVSVNTKLMGNHQQQIADKFSELGYVLVSEPKAEALSKVLVSLQRYELKPFSCEHSKEFENAVLKLAYS